MMPYVLLILRAHSRWPTMCSIELVMLTGDSLSLSLSLSLRSVARLSGATNLILASEGNSNRYDTAIYRHKHRYVCLTLHGQISSAMYFKPTFVDY